MQFINITKNKCNIEKPRIALSNTIGCKRKVIDAVINEINNINYFKVEAEAEINLLKNENLILKDMTQ